MPREVPWRTIAESRVFPVLATTWDRIDPARRALRAVIPRAEASVRRRLGFNGHLVHVRHVGTGCGAGSSTTLDGEPTILYGPECVAERGWRRRTRLTAHVAHEFAHAAHTGLRRGAGLKGGDPLRGPYG